MASSVHAHFRHATYFMEALYAAGVLYDTGGEALAQGLSCFDLDWANMQAAQSWATEHARKDDAAAVLCIAFNDVGIHLVNLRLSARERTTWLLPGLGAARRLNLPELEEALLCRLGVAYTELGALLSLLIRVGSHQAELVRSQLTRWRSQSALTDMLELS